MLPTMQKAEKLKHLQIPLKMYITFLQTCSGYECWSNTPFTKYLPIPHYVFASSMFHFNDWCSQFLLPVPLLLVGPSCISSSYLLVKWVPLHIHSCKCLCLRGHCLDRKRHNNHIKDTLISSVLMFYCISKE